jgi:NAD(P)-dependent dehydrogenase (short-subunit alcohol dehydrogenase family)
VAGSAAVGRLDALVNNAGIAVFTPLLETADADWSRILEVNLTGPFLCTKAAAPLMREHGGGAIVNITSISAVRASTLRSAYGTSKAGLAHLTKQLAVELASLGIRVNGVAPGPVETAMAKAVHTPEIRADYHDAIPLNRYGLEEELAEFSFCAAIGRATSPGRFSQSTAASTPPASACRRCAASGATAELQIRLEAFAVAA